MNRRRCTSRYDQAAIGRARNGSYGTFNLFRVTHVDWTNCHPFRRRYGLNCAELGNTRRICQIPKHSRVRYLRYRLSPCGEQNPNLKPGAFQGSKSSRLRHFRLPCV
jgi:hypothetical protein